MWPLGEMTAQKNTEAVSLVVEHTNRQTFFAFYFFSQLQAHVTRCKMYARASLSVWRRKSTAEQMSLTSDTRTRSVCTIAAENHTILIGNAAVEKDNGGCL